MKKRITAALLALLLMLSLTACGDKAEYRRVGKALATEDCVFAFREDDQVVQYVDAALRVLASAGVLSELSEAWFGEDLTTLEGDHDALLQFESLPQRVFIMGFDPTAVPMSFLENGSYTGFDIELTERLCDLLGWELQLQPIDPAEMELELSSGNVDCVCGGFSPTGTENISVSAVYMQSELLFVARTDSHVRSLKHRVLALSADPAASYALENNPSRRDAFSSIKPLAAVENCFNALDEGLCDVILVDSVAMVYYNTH